VNVKAIPIELIRLDGGTQIRACSTYQTKVDEYALAMTEDADFPPLTVFWDGEEYWLADGFHRFGAYNTVMQALELPGMSLPCEVIEGTQRDAILYACSANAVHGMPRTNVDKHNAVKTLLENPLVMIDLETGKPWNDHEIARRCVVGPDMVRRHREAIYRSALGSGAKEDAGSQERTVTRGGTTYVMKTANIGSKTEQPEAKTPVVVVPARPEPVPLPEAQPEPKPEPEPDGKVVEFKSKWDFIYTHLKEIDRAIEALPEPGEAAAKFPETLAHGLTVERCLEIQRWVQDFTRYWAARNPGIKRRHPDFFEEDQSVSAD
jgi:hypothetical protein